MSETVLVVGVGVIPFAKPGQSEAFDDIGAAAAKLAIADAGIEYGDIQQNETSAKISVNARKHAANNPFAMVTLIGCACVVTVLERAA